MKIMVSYLILFLLLLGGTAGHAQPQVDIGATFGPEGSGSFYFSIHEYFRVPEREVVVIRERRIPDEEIPYPPEEVIKMRSANKHFIVINDEVKKGKGKKEHLGEQGKGKKKEHGEGQGKGKGKDKGKVKD